MLSGHGMDSRQRIGVRSGGADFPARQRIGGNTQESSQLLLTEAEVFSDLCDTPGSNLKRPGLTGAIVMLLTSQSAGIEPHTTEMWLSTVW